MLRERRGRREAQRKSVEEVTCKPGFLVEDEGESSCSHFLVSHSFPHLHPLQSDFSHNMELLSSRLSVTFLWKIQWMHHTLPFN